MIYSKSFELLSKHDAPIAGGKGASLGEMTRAGIPVPPGFVILASTFDKFLELTDINIEIDSIISQVKHNEIHTVEQASKEIQAMIMGVETPDEIKREIESEFAKLNTEYVAVRSSATAEDSSSAAWAGQLDSFLNTTATDLLLNVKKCWASLFTPRAIFYRFEKELDKQQISVAVVVQKMVESEISGIAFSVHPVTEDYNQIIIEAGFGLGEAIVSGQITPDSYVITKEPRQILDKNISVQERGIYRHSSNIGSDWRDIPQTHGAKQCLSDEQILELTELILKIENHYSFPCDIEWAFESGVFYIVQSRPITTLAIKTVGDKTSVIDIKAFKESIKNREYITQQGNVSIALLGNICNAIQREYMSPYGYDHIQPILTLQKGAQGICYFDLEMYRDFSRVSYSRIKDSVYNLQEYRDYKEISEIIDREYQNFSLSRDVKELKLKILNYFDLAKRYLASSLYCEAVDHQIVQELAKKSSVKNIDRFVEIAILPTKPSFIVHQNELVLGGEDISWTFANYFAAPTPEERLKLSDKKYAEISKKEIKAEIKNTKKLVKKNKKLVEGLMAKSSIQQKKLIEFVQASIDIRDERKEFILKLFTILSDSLRALAKEYSISYEAISTIGYNELDNLDDSKFLKTLQRRSEQGVAMISRGDNFAIAIVDYESAKSIIFDQLDNVNEVIGLCANKGSYIGKIKIIISENDFSKFQDGEILVTGMTRAEYVPLMRKAGAIITDEGGVTCHAAIISRELNIPCIIGTKVATQILHDGDEVEVDADNGVVKIIKQAKYNNSDIEFGIEASEFDKVESSPITTLEAKMKEKIKLNLEHSRAYSLSKMTAWYKSLTYYFPKILGVGLEYTTFIYNKKTGLVDVFYDHDELNKIFKEITALTNKNPKVMEDNIKKFLHLFDKLKLYFNNKIKIKTDAEFSKLLNDYALYWTYVAIIFVLPRFDIPEKIKKLASEAREKTQEYNEHIEDVIQTFVNTRHSYLKSDFRFILPEEIKNKNINKEKILQKIKIRKNGFLYFQGYVYEGDINNNLEKLNLFIQNDLPKETSELKGQVAYQGKVTGKVRIITLKEQIKNFKDGEVLVSPMTMPSYLPAMKKAIAFITDEGGVTCHAAIIARELKKPCVIGTKFATQTLHDGDEVEVDADKGVVKILTKANQNNNGGVYKIPDTFNESLDGYQFQPEGGRAAFFFLNYLLLSHYATENKDWPMGEVNVVSSSTDHNAKWFRIHQNHEEYRNTLTRFINKPELVAELYQYLETNRVALVKKLQDKDYQRATNAELKSFFNEVIKDYYKVLRPSTIIRLIDLGLVNRLKEIFANRTDSDNCLAIISSSSKPSFSLSEEVAVLSLAVEANKKHLPINDKKIHDKLLNIFDKYCFSELGYYNEKTKTMDQYSEKLQEAMVNSPEHRLDQIQAKATELMTQREELLKDLNSTDKITAEIAEEVTHIKDSYKLAMNQVLFSSEALLMEISKRVNKSIDYIKDLLPGEIGNLLDQKDIDVELVETRIKNHVFVVFKKRLYLLSGDEAKKFNTKYLQFDKSLSEFKGRCASGGHVTGKAKIILSPKDFSKMLEGDILVVMNTSPDFTPILRKAKAIIAEEGGLTAHVSIVSREMGVPAVVGVNHITQILKDGDEVEVDADNGVVKIIKRK